MSKNFFEKNKLILDEIKSKHLNITKNIEEGLDDPVLSPYPFYCFSANRDPTDDEPLVYHGYDGLTLFWVHNITKQMFMSVDNLDPTLGWQKITTS